jgi:hypothetical protein
LYPFTDTKLAQKTIGHQPYATVPATQYCNLRAAVSLSDDFCDERRKTVQKRDWLAVGVGGSGKCVF